MRFPVCTKHRRQQATIHGRTSSCAFCRVSARIAGRRVVRPFSNCSAAREYAERSVRELERVDQSTALSPTGSHRRPGHSRGAGARFRETGSRVTDLEAVKGDAEALRKLGDHSLESAVPAFWPARRVSGGRMSPKPSRNS